MENKPFLGAKDQKEISFFSLAKKAMEGLPSRSQEVLKKRFGLDGKKPKTLDSIGKDYGITRERVRQIIADSLKKLFQKKPLGEELGIAKEKISLLIESGSGIINQEEFLSGMDPADRNALVFFVSCFPAFKVTERKGLLEKSWIVSEKILEKIKAVDSTARKFLEELDSPVEEEKLLKELSGKVSGSSEKEIRDILKSLSQICPNGFGKWGMCSWPEIRPKSTRDKIFLVLKENKKPLHFSKIAQLIDESGLSSRKAHPQTVHNELIKDKRFVLVGRGIYALSEWGYDRGTVREVLEKILREKGPLSRERVFEEIFKSRKVKKATVMINLNNPKFFSKKGDLFEVKKA